MFSAILNFVFSNFKLSFGYSTNSIAGGGMNFSTNSISGGGRTFSSSKKETIKTEKNSISEIEREIQNIDMQIALLQEKKKSLSDDLEMLKGGV